MDQFFDASGLGVEAQRLADGEVLPLGASRLAHVQGVAVGTLEHCGHAHLAGEPLAQGGPVRLDAVLLQRAPQDLHELIGEHGDEQVAIDPCFLVVEHRAQAEFGFEAAEHRLEIGEHAVGAPQGLGIPVGLAAAQAVDTRMGQRAARDGLAPLEQRNGLGAGGIGYELDGVELADTPRPGLEPADPFPEAIEALAGARLLQPGGEFVQFRLKTLGETLLDPGLLAGAAFRVAVQLDLVAVLLTEEPSGDAGLQPAIPVLCECDRSQTE